MEIVLKIRNVKEENGWYHFRKVIPEDLRHVFGFGEYKQSLETRDPLVADRLAKPLRKEWTLKIQAARRGGAIGAEERPSVHAVKFADDYIQQHIKGADRMDLEVLEETQLAPLLDDLHVALDSERCGLVKLARLVGEHGLFQWDDVKSLITGESGRRAFEFVLGMTTLIREAVLDEVPFAKLGGTPKLHAQVAQQIRGCAENPPKPLLSVVLEGAIEEDIDRKRRLTNHVGALIEWFGDRPCDQYSYSDLVTYRNECLSNMPDRRKEPFKSMTLRDAVKAASPEDAVSVATVENHLTSIKTVFKYAVRHHEITLNTERLLPKKKKTKHDNAPERRYSKDELQAMVNLLPTVKGSSARFWVPLVSLYQGSRLNETCQLHTNDVRLEKEAEVWILDFNGENHKETNKSIKTDCSWRKVPVHPVLIELGFVSFVEKRKQEAGSKNIQLFDDVKWSEDHDYKRPVERWYPKFRRKFLSSDRAKVMKFHSLRHTFAQQAQNQARMNDRIRKELGGWQVGEIAERYSGQHIVENLFPELQKLDYGIDLSPIMGLY